jgi:hypothetical protein
MNQFYAMGMHAAMEKLAQGGLLRSIGHAAKGTWEGMTPAAQGIAKRLGAGGAVGAAGGALAGGEEHRGLGALLGGAGGALGGAALGKALQGRSQRMLAKDLWEGATQTAAGRGRRADIALKRLEEMKPVYEQGARHLESRLLPGLSRY